ncbi:TPA: hypothetical protein EYP66_25115 [Candidatus Poribacteria bacterium]|nr:hypothetical protein [Candidatus Poribacteria bacterium]
MSSISNVCSEFLQLIENNDAESIFNLARQNRELTPFLQLPVLEKACAEYKKTEDDSCIRALVDNGFEIFITQFNYGILGDGLDPSFMDLTSTGLVQNAKPEVMKFLSYLYEMQFEKYVEKYGDESVLKNRCWISGLKDYKSEIQAYFDNPAGFNEYLDRKDSGEGWAVDIPAKPVSSGSKIPRLGR